MRVQDKIRMPASLIAQIYQYEQVAPLTCSQRSHMLPEQRRLPIEYSGKGAPHTGITIDHILVLNPCNLYMQYTMRHVYIANLPAIYCQSTRPILPIFSFSMASNSLLRGDKPGYQLL